MLMFTELAYCAERGWGLEVEGALKAAEAEKGAKLV